MNYFEFLTIDPIHSGKRTRVTKVTPKKYGFRVQMFNDYVTLYYLKIEINADKSAKISWKVDKNYQPIVPQLCPVGQLKEQIFNNR